MPTQFTRMSKSAKLLRCASPPPGFDRAQVGHLEGNPKRLWILRPPRRWLRHRSVLPLGCAPPTATEAPASAKAQADCLAETARCCGHESRFAGEVEKPGELAVKSSCGVIAAVAGAVSFIAAPQSKWRPPFGTTITAAMKNSHSGYAGRSARNGRTLQARRSGRPGSA